MLSHNILPAIISHIMLYVGNLWDSGAPFSLWLFIKGNNRQDIITLTQLIAKHLAHVANADNKNSFACL